MKTKTKNIVFYRRTLALLFVILLSGCTTSKAQTKARKPGTSKAAQAVKKSAPAALSENCLGEKRKMKIEHQMPYMTVKMGKAEGEFLLDFGTNFSSIDPSGFKNGITPVPVGAAELVDEQDYKFGEFDFFGRTGQVNLKVRKSHISGLSFKQAGIVGTDFFMEYIFTLDYLNGFIYRASKDAFCTDATLLKEGFRPVSTAGYYADNFSRLLDPATTINVPTVPIKIGKVAAVAQIDPGYDDGAYRHSVNINRAFYNALIAAGVVLEKLPGTIPPLSTCTGANEPITGYKLGKGYSFEITGTDSKPVVVATDAILLLKETPAEAKVCGGIGTWDIAAAQIGASFLNDAGRVIFDPFSSRVWFSVNNK